MTFYDTLTAQLRKHEGERLQPYRCTAGYLTIGVGRNLDAKGISQGESEILLMSDMEDVESDLDRSLPWWREESENVRLVLADMCFNLGIRGLLKFKRFLAAIERGDTETAKVEMMDSKWAGQVGRRATNLREML